MGVKGITKAAGVTFCNEEIYGGMHRQEILKNLYAMYKGIITVDLYRTIYQDNTGRREPAILLRHHGTNQVIGWIPKKDLRLVDNFQQMTGFIDWNKNIWYCTLDAPKHPSPAQYRLMQECCKKLGCIMPAYDVRAYGTWFAWMRSETRLAESQKG